MSDIVLFAIGLNAVAWFLLVVCPLVAIVGATRWIDERSRGLAWLVGPSLLFGWAVVGLPRPALGITASTVPPARPLIVRADFLISREARERVVALAEAHLLEASPRGDSDRLLPRDFAGLAVHGVVEAYPAGRGTVAFFLTLTRFSPDPYAGFERVPSGCTVIEDPLGSGHGVAAPLDDEWFWIEAR